jgi:hypothetical protein
MAIGTSIPSIITLLSTGGYDVSLATVSALVKLADYSEFVDVCYLDIADVGTKSSIASKLG